MARKARNLDEAPYYHVMVQGIKKEYIFKTDYYKAMYLRMLRKYMKENNIPIIAYCIMGNHAHMLLKITDNKSVSKAMSQLNTTFALNYNKEMNRVGYVFRNRFKTEAIYEKYYLHNCIKYIHMNPVKAKLCISQEEYNFSSYKDYLNKCGVLNNNLLREIFAIESEYQDIIQPKQIIYDFIDEEIEEEEARKIFEDYLKNKNLSIDFIKSNNGILKQTVQKMKKEYNMKCKDIANIIEVDKSKISRLIN